MSEASRVTGCRKWSLSFKFDRTVNENTGPMTWPYTAAHSLHAGEAAYFHGRSTGSPRGDGPLTPLIVTAGAWLSVTLGRVGAFQTTQIF